LLHSGAEQITKPRETHRAGHRKRPIPHLVDGLPIGTFLPHRRRYAAILPVARDDSPGATRTEAVGGNPTL